MGSRTVRDPFLFLPHENKRQQHDIHRVQNRFGYVETHVTRFLEETFPDSAVRPSDCLVRGLIDELKSRRQRYRAEGLSAETYNNFRPRAFGLPIILNVVNTHRPTRKKKRSKWGEDQSMTRGTHKVAPPGACSKTWLTGTSSKVPGSRVSVTPSNDLLLPLHKILNAKRVEPSAWLRLVTVVAKVSSTDFRVSTMYTTEPVPESRMVVLRTSSSSFRAKDKFMSMAWRSFGRCTPGYVGTLHSQRKTEAVFVRS